jgi:hypothetical protein
MNDHSSLPGADCRPSVPAVSADIDSRHHRRLETQE